MIRRDFWHAPESRSATSETDHADRRPGRSPTRPSRGGPGVIDKACNCWDRRGRLQAARLMAEPGAYMPVPALPRTIAMDCPRMQVAQVRDVCGAHVPNLSGLRL